MKHVFRFLTTCIALFFGAPAVQAQELIYQVYQFETPYKGHAVLKAHDTYISKSNLSNEHFGKKQPDRHLFGHSFEAELGIGDHLELSAYADFAKPTNGNFKYTQSHFSLMYRIGERFDHFVNVALYAEYYFPERSYTTSQEAELRVILDKDIEDFRVVLNPSVSRAVGGEERKTLNPGLNGAVYYRRYFGVQPGIEYYSDFNESRHIVFPTLDFHITPGITWNVGAGFGLTHETDKLVFKSNLAFDIEAIRPAHLFRKPYTAG